MNLLIIGASRGIGRQLLDQAWQAGHQVTAFARHPPKLSQTAGGA